jgi:hypothetical protein
MKMGKRKYAEEYREEGFERLARDDFDAAMSKLEAADAEIAALRERVVELEAFASSVFDVSEDHDLWCASGLMFQRKARDLLGEGGEG